MSRHAGTALLPAWHDSFSGRNKLRAQGVAGSIHYTWSPSVWWPSKGRLGTLTTMHLLWLLVQEWVHGLGRDLSARQLERRKQRPGSQNHLGELLQAAPCSPGGPQGWALRTNRKIWIFIWVKRGACLQRARKAEGFRQSYYCLCSVSCHAKKCTRDGWSVHIE